MNAVYGMLGIAILAATIVFFVAFFNQNVALSTGAVVGLLVLMAITGIIRNFQKTNKRPD